MALVVAEEEVLLVEAVEASAAVAQLTVFVDEVVVAVEALAVVAVVVALPVEDEEVAVVPAVALAA